MNSYTINPTDGAHEAFRVLNPLSDNSDFFAWLGDQDDSESDPRLMNYALAVLCDQALTEMLERQSAIVCPNRVAMVAGALSHFETAIRSFTAVIGHDRFERLSKLDTITALKTCLPNDVQANDLV